MLLTVNHTTNYNYDDNLIGLMQTTKLIPSPYNGLKIIEWDVTRNSEKGGEIFKDAEGNNIINFKSNDSDKIINFTVIGKVETFNTDGIYNSKNDKISPLVYLRNTNLTQPNKEILDLASDAKGKFENSETLKIAHSILALVSDQISYVPYTTNTHTTAAEAMSQKKGVCQDHKLCPLHYKYSYNCCRSYESKKRGLPRSSTYYDLSCQSSRYSCKIRKWLYAQKSK